MSSGDINHFDDDPGSIAKLRALLLRFPSIGARMRLHRRILRGFTIPYLAGINWKGDTTYIDERMPTHINGIPVDKFLDLHEAVELAIWTEAHQTKGLEEYKVYEPCHHLATAAEQFAVIGQGYDWKKYKEGLHPDYLPIEREKIGRVPPDVATYPYKGKLLKLVVDAAKKTRFTQDEVRYRLAEGRQSCEDCGMFLPKLSACTWVEDKIIPEGLCDKWDMKEEKAS
jgi:hypothetical protein